MSCFFTKWLKSSVSHIIFSCLLDCTTILINNTSISLPKTWWWGSSVLHGIICMDMTQGWDISNPVYLLLERYNRLIEVSEPSNTQDPSWMCSLSLHMVKCRLVSLWQWCDISWPQLEGITDHGPTAWEKIIMRKTLKQIELFLHQLYTQ